MVKASENEYPQVTFAEGSAPSTPGTGLVLAYAKTDGKLYIKDDAGTETDLTDAGAGSSVTVANFLGDGSGNITTTSTTATDMTGVTVDIAASENDVLVVHFTATVNNSAASTIFVLVEIGGTDEVPTVGVYPDTVDQQRLAHLHTYHVVQAGDISGGDVTVQMRWYTASSGTATVRNDATVNRRPELTVINYGS